MYVVIGVIAIIVLLYLLSRMKIALGAGDRIATLELQVERLTTRLLALETRAPEAAVAKVPVPLAREQAAPPPPVQSEATEVVIRPKNMVPVPPPAPPVPAQIAARVAEPIAQARIAETIPAPEPTPVRVSVPAPDPVKVHVSLEERLGHNWLNKLGIVILVTGLVLLLGYQVRSLGAAGKSALGLFLSVAILATGLVLERRERYQVFGRAAIGGGWALLYFVTFGLFHVSAMQVLHSQVVDLILVLVVAAGMVLHSLKYRSQVVTSLAFLLGFFIVAISHVTVFSLVASAILAAGLVVVAFRQRWFVLQVSGLVAVYLNHFLWLHRLLPDGGQPGYSFAEFLPSVSSLLFYWLLFRAFYIFRVPDNDRDRVCSTLNVLLNSAGLLGLLKYQSSHPEWAFRSLLALGAVELVLAFVARRRFHTGFVVLASIASVLMLAAVPFHFAGSSWSLGWLLESELLFVAGLSLRETVFRRLGILSAYAAVMHLLIVGAFPVFELRQAGPDVSHHLGLTIAFACAALASWFNAEYATRRWSHVAALALDAAALRGLSYLAVLCAGVAIWLAVPGQLTLLPWLALALLLAFAADRLQSSDLAQQADVLAVAAVARAAAINFPQWVQHPGSARTLILLGAAALLYGQMRRKQPAHGLPQQAIAPAYTWAGAALLGTLAWYALQPAAVAIAWAVLGTVLLELGIAGRKTYFRQQGVALLAASFGRLFFINIALDGGPRLYTILPLAVLFAWAYQRLYTTGQPTPFDRMAGAMNAWFALGTTATLLYFSLHPAWVSIGGAVLAVAVLLLARVLGRPLFRAQAIALVLVTVGRTLAFNVLSASPLTSSFTGSRIFTVAVTCALLLAALPIAYTLRRQTMPENAAQPAWFHHLLAHPEQVFFFATLTVLFALVPVQLRAGMMTIGWSVLGLLAFLFALTVSERSFRLSGLGLLLLAVGKVLTVDVWQASPIDRYITLIVMGGVLLLVSFLYSRYREQILELL